MIQCTVLASNTQKYIIEDSNSSHLLCNMQIELQPKLNCVTRQNGNQGIKASSKTRLRTSSIKRNHNPKPKIPLST